MADYKAIYKADLDNACAKLLKSLNAVQNRTISAWDIAKKGKTLSIVNRRECHAKLTVNY